MSDATPSYENGFTLPGKECLCDNEFACENHDRDAEYAYWSGFARIATALHLDIAAEYADRVYDDKPYKYGGIPE